MNTTVGDVMTAPVMTAAKHQTAAHLAQVMRSHKVSAMAVVGPDQEPLGIVTATDLLDRHSDTTPVSELMTKPVYSVPVDEGTHVAARIMRNHHLHHVAVTDHGAVVGIVSAYDLLALVEDHRYTAKAAPTPARREPRRQ